MEIVKFPNPSLFEVCETVNVFGPELKVLLDSMWETMNQHNGVGLAANQVGLNLRMFIMLGPIGEKIYVVNPLIISKSEHSANLREGCLSAPGEFLTLPERASWVKVQYHNEKGELKESVFKDIYAVCFQHELDHLNGKSHLQSKSISKSVRKAVAKRWGLKVK